MPDVIQCPTCAKQYRLPERPPATFACRACGTTMDLSAFRGAAAPAAPAPAPEPAAEEAAETRPHVSHGARSSRRHGVGAGRSSRVGRSSSVRSRRGRAEEEDEEGEASGADWRAERAKKSQQTLIIGSVIGFVVVLGLAFVVMRRKEEPPRPQETKAPEPPPVAPPKTTAPAMEGGDAAMDGANEAPKVIMASKVQWHPVDHSPDATPDERAKIDDLIQKAVFENLGRDSRDAGHELVKFGLKAAPRLVNIFSTVKAGEGFDTREGRVKASLADGYLREIDGFMDRKKKGMSKITAASDPRHAENVAKTWLAWWDLGGWKAPEKPWDPAVDGKPDEEPTGMGGGSSGDK